MSMELFTVFANANTLFTFISKVKSFFEPVTTRLSDWKYRKEDFYLVNCKKHTTVYKNGNGIIYTEFDLRVIKPERSGEIEVWLNCMDGKKSLHIPPLAEMLDLPQTGRFNDFGFWYDTKDGIIQNVVEKNGRRRYFNKKIHYKLDINESKLMAHKTYHCIYAVSIPDLYPIVDGKLNKNLLYKKYNTKDYKTSTGKVINTPTKNFEFITSFEKDVVFEQSPICSWTDSKGQSKATVHGVNVDELFYNKYCYKVKNPKVGDKIFVEWLNESI